MILKNKKDKSPQKIQVMYFSLSAAQKEEVEKFGYTSARYNPKRHVTFEKWIKNQRLLTNTKTVFLNKD